MAFMTIPTIGVYDSSMLPTIGVYERRINCRIRQVNGYLTGSVLSPAFFLQPKRLLLLSFR